MAEWFVGVTTAPRPGGSLLAATAASLAKSGWDNVTVLAEPESVLGDVGGNVTRVLWNSEKFGAWRNFLQAVEIGADADFVAVVQDDVETAFGLRRHLEATIMEPGWHSPYCPGYANEFIVGGWCPIPVTQEHRGHGGCFFACTGETAKRFLRTKPTDVGINGTDMWVSKWSRRTKTPLWYHSPSLVQHVGLQSTIHPGTGLCWMRAATNYCRDVETCKPARSC